MRPWLLIVAGVVVVGVLAGAMAVFTPGVVLVAVGGVVGAALTAYLSQDGPKHLQQALARRRERRELATGVPVSCTVQIQHQDYVVVGAVDVPASGHTVRVVATGVSAAPVVLTGLRAEVVSRGDCHGDLARHAAELPVRRFEARLDDDPPRVRPLGGSDFPYRLVKDETEVLDVVAVVDAGEVHWRLWLDWSSSGRTGALPVDLGGQPFRTAARHDIPA